MSSISGLGVRVRGFGFRVSGLGISREKEPKQLNQSLSY